jgi:hypothetical protein
MPFGIANAPSTFQRTMTSLLGHLSFVFVYLDDILIFSSTPSEHINHLTQVFHILQNANLTINQQKSQFYKTNVEYLGFNISANGITPSPRNLNILQNLPMPQTKSQLRKILGTLNFFRNLLPNFSQRLANVTSLLQNNTSFIWSSNHTTTISNVVQDIIKTATLHHPDFSKTFELYADASDQAIGAALLQNGSPIFFISQKLTIPQRHYSTSEKELLAIVITLQKLRKFLLGTNIDVFTDHRNLTHLEASTNTRLQRWSLLLNEFNLTIRYLAGSHNSLADFLSRPIQLLHTSLITPTDTTSKNSILHWYHLKLQHPGTTRQYYTMRSLYNWPNMFQDIAKHINNCHTCHQIRNETLWFITRSSHLNCPFPTNRLRHSRTIHRSRRHAYEVSLYTFHHRLMHTPR